MGKRQPSPADFELIYHAEGTVELFNGDGQSVWQSDSDDEFADEFDGDFFDDTDTDDILEYLDEKEFIDLSVHSIDIVENDLVDESNEDVIDGELVIDHKRRDR